MKKIILAMTFAVVAATSVAKSEIKVATEVAKCPVYAESVVSREYINKGKDVRVQFMLLGGSSVVVTIPAKDYMRFILKEAAYDLVMLSDKSVVMRSTLQRIPR